MKPAAAREHFAPSILERVGKEKQNGMLISLCVQSRKTMALFYFLRHGETAWNAEGRFCGGTDVPMSDVGRRQAQLLARRFQAITVEALYSSPLSRALETARIIGSAIGREPKVDPRLTELSYGEWEGQTLEEFQCAAPAAYLAWDQDPANLAPPGGETGMHLIERATPFLAEVAQRHPQGNVVVVCHKTVIRLLACHIMGHPLTEYRRSIAMQNAAVNIFETVGEKWRVVALNDTEHLAESDHGPKDF
jgi:broad specificity phosphatase PhoE